MCYQSQRIVPILLKDRQSVWSFFLLVKAQAQVQAQTNLCLRALPMTSHQGDPWRREDRRCSSSSQEALAVRLVVRLLTVFLAATVSLPFFNSFLGCLFVAAPLTYSYSSCPSQ